MLNNKKVSLDPQKYKIQPATTKFKTEESEWISPPREKVGNKYSMQIEKPVEAVSRDDDTFSRKSPNLRILWILRSSITMLGYKHNQISRK